MKKFNLYYFTAIGIAVLSLFSCDDKPKPLGLVSAPTFDATTAPWGSPITITNYRSTGYTYAIKTRKAGVSVVGNEIHATQSVRDVIVIVARDADGAAAESDPISFTRKTGTLTFANKSINKAFDPLDRTYKQEATKSADDTGAIRYAITSADGGNASIGDDGTVTFTKRGTYTITATKAESLKYTDAKGASYVLQITTFAKVLGASSSSTLWSGRNNFQAVIFKNKLYVIGGYGNSDSQFVSILHDVWSTEDGVSWTQETTDTRWSNTSIVQTELSQAVVFKDKLYVMNKVRILGHNTKNEIWSTENSSSWAKVSTTDLPWFVERDSFQAIEFKNKLYVMGGNYDGIERLSDVWSTEDGVSWTQETAYAGWGKRSNFQAVVFKDKLYVMGGLDNARRRLNDIWRTADGSSWTEITVSGGHWSKRSSFQAVVFREKLYVISGSDGKRVLSDVWSTEDGVSWTRETADVGWGARSSFQAVEFKNKVYVMGGYHSKRKTKLNDVWNVAVFR